MLYFTKSKFYHLMAYFYLNLHLKKKKNNPKKLNQDS